MHTTAASSDASASADIPTVLSVAAGYLEQHGWCQGNLYGNSNGNSTEPSACAIGALAVAVYGQPTNPSLHDQPWSLTIDRASQAVLDWLGIEVKPDDALHELIEWNDTSGRTADQVIGTFRAVADEQRRAA